MNRKVRKRLSRIPEHYSVRVDQSLEQILGRGYPDPTEGNIQTCSGGRRGGITGTIRVAAAVFVCIFCFLFAYPAYAAGIPLLNRIIYTISPTVTESGEINARAAEKISAVLKDFMENDVLLYTGLEQTGENWQINVDTLHVAYYFKQRIQEMGGERAASDTKVTIRLQSVETRRKGYEIKVQAVCRISGDGIAAFSERIRAVLIEKPERLTVVGMEEIETEER